MLVAWHNGRVIEHVEQMTSLFRKEDLLFCALDYAGEVDVVSFFEFLARLKCGMLEG